MSKRLLEKSSRATKSVHPRTRQRRRKAAEAKVKKWWSDYEAKKKPAQKKPQKISKAYATKMRKHQEAYKSGKARPKRPKFATRSKKGTTVYPTSKKHQAHKKIIAQRKGK